MIRALSSFYAKLGLLFLGLVVALGLALAYIAAQSLQRFANETEQKLNMTLASDLARRLEPLLAESIADSLIYSELLEISGINPRIDVYLLDPDGNVLAQYFLGDSGAVASTRVDLTPVHRLLGGAPPPVLGTDPAYPNRRKPFSAAGIEIMGKSGFLYIILSGAEYDSVVSMIRGSYILRAAGRGLAVVLGVTAILGLLLFRQLTRRLRRVRDSVHRFAQGNLEERVSDSSPDEIGQLAESFNQMADTIVANVDQLKRIDQQRRELVANVSHDLRSPLSSMQGYLETIVIKDEELSQEERRRYMETILSNTRSLARMIAELFELSKLDAHQVTPDIEPFSVAELIQDVVIQLQPRASEGGVQLRADLPAQIDLVAGDVGLIERVLLNLIENAIEFTPAGGTVRVVPSPQNGRLRVSVEDTGTGIPENELPYIFDRFYKVDKSRSAERGGAGLGLAIAQRIVELHDSHLAVESREGAGTTFSFSLRRWSETHDSAPA
jgi:signal transduction histidine kinase